MVVKNIILYYLEFYYYKNFENIIAMYFCCCVNIGKKAGLAVWCCPCLLNWRPVSHSSLPRIPHVKGIKELYIHHKGELPNMWDNY